MDVYDMDEINEALIHLEGLADTFTAMNKDIEVTPERSRRKCMGMINSVGVRTAAH